MKKLDVFLKVFCLIYLLMHLASCSVSRSIYGYNECRVLIKKFNKSQKKQIRNSSTFLSRNIIRKSYFKYTVNRYRNNAFYGYFRQNDSNSNDTLYVFESIDEIDGSVNGYIISKNQISLVYNYKPNLYGFESRVDSVSYSTYKESFFYKRVGEEIFNLDIIQSEIEKSSKTLGGGVLLLSRIVIQNKNPLKYKIDMLLTESW